MAPQKPISSVDSVVGGPGGGAPTDLWEPALFY